jgi:hypothetical protein
MNVILIQENTWAYSRDFQEAFTEMQASDFELKWARKLRPRLLFAEELVGDGCFAFWCSIRKLIFLFNMIGIALTGKLVSMLKTQSKS